MQWYHVCDCISDIHEMRSIFRRPVQFRKIAFDVRLTGKWSTVFVHLHAHCAWTIPERSPWFKPIVMDLVWVERTFTNPLLLSPIDTIETCGCCWAWNCLCYSTFCTTSVSQNAKITWNTSSSECMQSVEKEGCASIWAWACKWTNTVMLHGVGEAYWLINTGIIPVCCLS